MKFLVDAQLPPALATWIVERGHEAQHVANIGMVSATDEDVWRFALSTGAVVVTKDHDFVEWAASRRPAPLVLWIRMGNSANEALIRRLDAVWEIVAESLSSGALVVEASGP